MALIKSFTALAALIVAAEVGFAQLMPAGDKSP
jgi:hypothetical protein